MRRMILLKLQEVGKVTGDDKADIPKNNHEIGKTIDDEEQKDDTGRMHYDSNGCFANDNKWKAVKILGTVSLGKTQHSTI